MVAKQSAPKVHVKMPEQPPIVHTVKVMVGAQGRLELRVLKKISSAMFMYL